MLEVKTLTDIVDEINNLYGNEHFLPAEYVYQDGVHYVKVFGKFVWDSGNSDATSPSSIKHLVYYVLNNHILVNVWKSQTEYLKEELEYIMHTEAEEVSSIKVLDFLREELESLGSWG